MSDEEARAAQFRADRAARLQAITARGALLKGSDAAFTALQAAWQPVVDWLAERRAPAFPTPEDLQQQHSATAHERVASLPGLATQTVLDRDPPIRDLDA